MLKLRKRLLGELLLDPASLAIKLAKLKEDMPGLDACSVLKTYPHLLREVLEVDALLYTARLVLFCWNISDMNWLDETHSAVGLASKRDRD